MSYNLIIIMLVLKKSDKSLNLKGGIWSNQIQRLDGFKFSVEKSNGNELKIL